MKKYCKYLILISILVFMFGLNVHAESNQTHYYYDFDYEFHTSGGNWSGSSSYYYDSPYLCAFCLPSDINNNGRNDMIFYIYNSPSSIDGYCCEVQNMSCLSYTGSLYTSSTRVLPLYGEWFDTYVKKNNSVIASTNIPIFLKKIYMINYFRTGDDSSRVNKPEPTENDDLLIHNLHSYLDNDSGINSTITWDASTSPLYPSDNLQLEFKMDIEVRNKISGDKKQLTDLSLDAMSCHDSQQKQVLNIYHYIDSYTDEDLTMYSFMKNCAIKVYARYKYTDDSGKVSYGIWQDTSKDYSQIADSINLDLNFKDFKYYEDRSTTPYSHKVEWSNEYTEDTYLLVNADITWFTLGRQTTVNRVPIVSKNDSVSASSGSWSIGVPDMITNYFDSQGIDGYSSFKSQYANKLYFQVIKQDEDGNWVGSAIQYVDLKNQTTGNYAGSDTGTGYIDENGNFVANDDNVHLDDSGEVSDNPYDDLELSEDNTILAFVGNLWKTIQYSIKSVFGLFGKLIDLFTSMTSGIPMFYKHFLPFLPTEFYGLITLTITVCIICRIIGR